DIKANSNQQKFAEMIGFSPQVIGNIVCGRKSKPSYDVIEAILTIFVDIYPEWLITGQEPMLKEDLPKVVPSLNPDEGFPLIPIEAFGGIGNNAGYAIDFDVIEERYVIPLFEGKGVDFLIPVRGSSMYPKYSSGDVVACKFVSELLFIQWNKTYVLDTKTQGAMIKRLLESKDPEKIICRSDNKEYPDFEVPLKDIQNIALVVGVIRLE